MNLPLHHPPSLLLLRPKHARRLHALPLRFYTCRLPPQVPTAPGAPVPLPAARRFAYVTSGFSLLFSLLLSAGGYVTLKQGASGFLPSIYGSLSLFGSFWWMVAAITFTQRGKQASDDGLPEESARNGVIALSWLEFILFLAAGVAVIYDRCGGMAWGCRRMSWLGGCRGGLCCQGAAVAGHVLLCNVVLPRLGCRLGGAPAAGSALIRTCPSHPVRLT